MLTLILLSAVFMQTPPTPPTPPSLPPPPSPPLEVHSRMVFVGAGGTGGLDKDGDGQISREEFGAPLNDHFAQVDRDGDGRLSADELKEGGDVPGDRIIIHSGPGGGDPARRLELRRPGTSGSRVESEVRTLILGGGGDPGGRHEIVVSRSGGEDGPHVIRFPGGGSGSHSATVHRFGGPGGDDIDADKDGRISEAEFTGPLREAFARMDADRSGFIEAGERGEGGDVRVFTQRIETRQDGED